MNLTQNAFAVAPGIKASFQANGGDEPYLYEVLPGGAGGSINPTTGIYQAPYVWDPDATKGFDTIRATDYSGDEVESLIRVGSPLLLFCEIIQRELSLPDGRVYLYSQKKQMPEDGDIYVAISVDRVNYYSSSNKGITLDDGASFISSQWVTYSQTLGVNIESRTTKALWRKDEVVLALGSDYSKMQQNRNTFGIARLPLSPMMPRPVQDGAAIPYRFYFQVNVNFTMPKGTPIEFYDTFQSPEISIEP